MSDDLEPRLREVLEERARVRPETVDRVVAGIGRLPDRGRRDRAVLPMAAIAAVVIVAIVGLALVELTRRPADIAAPPTSPPATPSATVAASPAGQPRPVWAIGLADHLDCDGPPSTIGMDVPAVPEAVDPAASPDAALERIRRDYPSLPESGWTRVLISGHWALHRYIVDGRPKVHVVSTDLFPDTASVSGWQVVGLRACDPSEFAAVEPS
jgi:hypothetical protein